MKKHGGMMNKCLKRGRCKRNHTLWVISLVLASTSVLAQSTPSRDATIPKAKAAAYDVVTIKPNKTGSGSVSADTEDDIYSATNVSVKMMMQNAYDIKLDLIFGLKGWAESDRFDVQAKIVDMDAGALKKLTLDQRRGMLRQLLEDHFQLKVHKEIQVLPIYKMVIAKGGSKLKEVEPPSSDGADDAQKTFNSLGRGNMKMGSTQLYAHDVGLSMLTSMLSHQLHRPVVDKTGLEGKYDLALTWSPDDASASTPDSPAPYLFTALQEQMGLRLQAAKGPVETLIVDHIEMPAEN